MSANGWRGHAARLGRTARADRLGGFIYGTVVSLTVIVAAARAYSHAPGHIAVLVVVTSVVLWLAHVYSHGLAHSVRSDTRFEASDLKEIAYRESSIIEAGLLPVLPLLLGALGVLSDQGAIWTALGVGLGVLAAQGVTFARTERLGRLATLAVVAANVGLGALLILLKVTVTHH